jgi:hypothetical protein
MMGRQVAAPQLFYEFCLDHVPDDHLLRRVDRLVDLESVRTELKPFYSMIGRPLMPLKSAIKTIAHARAAGETALTVHRFLRL